MLAFKVNFFDDLRMCNPVCHESAIAFLNTGCDGLCDPQHDMATYHQNRVCISDGASPLPYMDSFMFNKPFEKMRV